MLHAHMMWNCDYTAGNPIYDLILSMHVGSHSISRIDIDPFTPLIYVIS